VCFLLIFFFFFFLFFFFFVFFFCFCCSVFCVVFFFFDGIKIKALRILHRLRECGDHIKSFLYKGHLNTIFFCPSGLPLWAQMSVVSR